MCRCGLGHEHKPVCNWLVKYRSSLESGGLGSVIAVWYGIYLVDTLLPNKRAKYTSRNQVGPLTLGTELQSRA